MKQINRNEVFELQPDGSSILIRVEEVEVDVKTPEEEVAEKEAELLRMFNELQELKNKLQ
jgi:hypothetical protein